MSPSTVDRLNHADNSPNEDPVIKTIQSLFTAWADMERRDSRAALPTLAVGRPQIKTLRDIATDLAHSARTLASTIREDLGQVDFDQIQISDAHQELRTVVDSTISPEAFVRNRLRALRTVLQEMREWPHSPTEAEEAHIMSGAKTQALLCEDILLSLEPLRRSEA